MLKIFKKMMKVLNLKYKKRRKLKMKVLRKRCANAARRINFHRAKMREFGQKLIIRLRLSIRSSYGFP